MIAGKVAYFTVAVVIPYVLARQTTVDASAAGEVVILTRLAADGTYAVGIVVIAGFATLGAVVVYPLVLALGIGRYCAADEIELEDHAAVHEVAVLVKSYLFIIPVYCHPVCAVCHGFLIGSAEVLADKFSECDLVANLVFLTVICYENVISGE